MKIISKDYLSSYIGDERREEVINYVREKYGNDRVSKIITLGRMGAKGAINDTARIWNKDTRFSSEISKLIPSRPNITIDEALKESTGLKQLYDGNLEVRDIIDKAKKIEGLLKSSGVHACGIIIGREAITNFCPQSLVTNRETGKKEWVTQYTMEECESIGLLKMDFLALKTMTILNESIEDINESYGQKLAVNNLPVNDVEVYEHIFKGNTRGVFQIESPGMTGFMKNLFQDVPDFLNSISNSSLTKEQIEKKKEEFGDILFERLIAGISLYRPGPMEEIPNYINNMINPEQIHYDTPELESILKNTYGIIIYQEQVINIVIKLAGFSKGQGDWIRKAMGKKKDEILKEYEPYFIYGSGDAKDKVTKKPLNIVGCINNEISEDVAKSTWNKMKDFSKYAFNKSHGGGYSLLSYQTAWISHYYPVIFMKSNLNVYITNTNKCKAFLAYCSRKNITVLPPSINKSNKKFSVENNCIRFGFQGIKNLGCSSELIIKERESERGLFKNFQDFIERMVKYQKTDKRVIENLIFAGALDCFKDSTRKEKLEIIPSILESSKLDKKKNINGQISLFDIEDFSGIKEIVIPKLGEFNKDYLLEKEKEVANIYISAHPLDNFMDLLEKEDIVEIVDLISEDDEYNKKDNENYLTDFVGNTIYVAGIVKDVQIKYSKRNKPFYIFNLEDKTGEIKCVCFNKLKNEDNIVEKKKLIIKAELTYNDFGYQLNVLSSENLELKIKKNNSILITGSQNRDEAVKQWKYLKEFVNKNKGNSKVYFEFEEVEYSLKNKLNLSWENLYNLQTVFGENNCKLNISMKNKVHVN
ncbi:TPA: OB-fold nucleic acid binding domain-containing protein [Clostridioides difficile]|uniref:helix-hairpin-helix domain-containing protein n=1 Tax=Clostridioides difficile TaxID=1496 RepID=UPI001F45C80F|nr:OB-fold nucleic acid binding domain-containing protein [Clostridioides difficile]